MSDGAKTVPVSKDSEMRVTDIFSFNDGLEALQSQYEDEFRELLNSIESNKAENVFVKESSEDRLEHKYLASPVVMNHLILIVGLHDEYRWAVDHAPARGKSEIEKIGKEPKSVKDEECEVDVSPDARWGKKTIDGMKNKMGVEIQFGKYSFMVYDVLAKFAHLSKYDRINLGIEVVPSNNLVRDMSSGPGYFGQLKSELAHLPDNYISEEEQIPVLVLGVGFEDNSIDMDNLEEEVSYSEQTTLSN
jgi:hypothetical protein